MHLKGMQVGLVLVTTAAWSLGGSALAGLGVVGAADVQRQEFN